MMTGAALLIFLRGTAAGHPLGSGWAGQFDTHEKEEEKKRKTQVELLKALDRLLLLLDGAGHVMRFNPGRLIWRVGKWIAIAGHGIIRRSPATCRITFLEAGSSFIDQKQFLGRLLTIDPLAKMIRRPGREKPIQ